MMENTDASIGRILKDRRQELGYTLQAAEEATRIRKTYLDSLENNRFSELPGQAYVTGFIRIYAGYLGLKSNPLLALLNDLQSVETKPEETIKTARPLPDLRAESSSGGDWRKFFLVFILILVLGCLLYFMPVMFSGDEQIIHSTAKVTESVGSRVDPGKSQAMQQPRTLSRPVLLQRNRAPTIGPCLLFRIMERHYGCLLWLTAHL
jgi:cytoskeletal protein RodZ